MGSTPKRWVIQPLSPKLEQAHLRALLNPASPEGSSSRETDSLTFKFDSISIARTMAGVTVTSQTDETDLDVVVQARQVSLSEEGSTSASEDRQPSNPSTPSRPGSYCGFYAFVDEPGSPEAESNEAYMTSPERQVKLTTIKQESAYTLQTYAEERRPVRLFQETNGDAPYQAQREEDAEEEEKLDRLEIIRSQAPRRKPEFKEQWSALDVKQPSQSLVDGFSIVYSPVRSKPDQNRPEPGTINNEQIDFNAARKQFLMMEQSQLSAVLQNRKQQTRFPLTGTSPTTNHSSAKQPSLTPSPQHDKGFTYTAEQSTVTLTKTTEDKIQGSPATNDPQSTVRDLHRSNGSSNELLRSDAEQYQSVTSSSETPIEREIRIAQEREESLRRSRGITRSGSSELIEIRTKHLPSTPPASPLSMSVRARDTNRVSFLIQREIENDRKREKEMDRKSSGEGGLSDLFSRNHVGDKKRMFEPQKEQAQTTALDSPVDTARRPAVAVEEMWVAERPVLVDGQELSDSEEDEAEEEPLSPCCPHRHPNEIAVSMSRTEKPSYAGGHWSPPTGVKVLPSPLTEERTHIPSLPLISVQRQKTDLRAGPESLPSSPTTESSQISSPRWRSHLDLFDESPRLQNAPDLIRREMEQDQRREQELLEQRAANLLLLSSHKPTEPGEQPSHREKEKLSSPTSAHTDLVDSAEQYTKMMKSNDYFSRKLDQNTDTVQSEDENPATRLPSISILAAQPWGRVKPSSPTVAQVPPHLPTTPTQRGLTETLLGDFEERRIRQKQEEAAYAGIQPIDDINNEVVESTRVTRHKNLRALRWEAGVYENQSAD
ncbi:mitotic interactor and substrate of PLK1 [Chanos chanos]|uniref:Mitotic interactor and substrate of PLK1 n=1 Tax=Chanos chanos TaxID=29144 RepID=A0A6J2W2P9_CHACN|nr:mitotic interactor and substrate of PLK1 [Chanos chanos]